MCGRKLRVPMVASFRPTQDMVREALGSLLMAEMPGSSFLDLYAGSGAVGFEALSRGAAFVAWVEADRRNWRLLRDNAEALGIDASNAFCADAQKWIATAGARRRFDIVFADPPYADTRAQGMARILEKCAELDVVREGGVFVGEQASDTPAPAVDGWVLARDRVYGKTRLAIWRRAAAAPAPLDAVGKEDGNG